MSKDKKATIEDVAAFLKVPVSWVYNRTRRNQIPCVRVGKYIRFNLDDIDAWARNGGAEVRRGGES